MRPQCVTAALALWLAAAGTAAAQNDGAQDYGALPPDPISSFYSVYPLLPSSRVVTMIQRGEPLPTSLIPVQVPAERAMQLPQVVVRRAIVGRYFVLMDAANNVVDILPPGD